MFKSNQEPDIPAALGLLSHLSNEELNELLNNDDKFEDIVKDIKQVNFINLMLYYIIYYYTHCSLL